MTTCDDLSAVQLLEIPDSAPPFDGEMSAARGPAEPKPKPKPTTVRAAAATAGEPEATGSGDWPAQFARLLAEVLAGHRPARQLLPFTTERVRMRIRRLSPGFCAGQQPRVLRIHASQPAIGIIEMSVVINLGARTRALALRLERVVSGGRPARWLCTDIEAA
ncbi:MAG TPA: Rv3235 family protein [Trebonia sp.]|jgi:hypothetical protein|nr:Rv3235 family protein [Trebonia sp.]